MACIFVKELSLFFSFLISLKPTERSKMKPKFKEFNPIIPFEIDYLLEWKIN